MEGFLFVRFTKKITVSEISWVKYHGSIEKLCESIVKGKEKS